MNSTRALIVAAPEQLAPLLATLPADTELVYRTRNAQLHVFGGPPRGLRALARQAKTHGLHYERLACTGDHLARTEQTLDHFRGRGWVTGRELAAYLRLTVSTTHTYIIRPLLETGDLLRYGHGIHIRYCVACDDPPPHPRQILREQLRQLVAGRPFTTTDAMAIFGYRLNAERAIRRLIQEGSVQELPRPRARGRCRLYAFADESISSSPVPAPQAQAKATRTGHATRTT